ncbi:MAG: ketoacyl-ACP synthase III [Acidimicrobiia bacterium]|nr:ketoacyl-ACP synthase III [Acidimicrobiia bacterium]MDH5292902.1 ketoacyl-ACP synthase III [Acidimicrobiia bacterium]
MHRSRFIGIGSYLPPRVVTNDDLAEMMDTSDEWIKTRSGISERRWVEPDVTTTDLGLKAADAALDSAGLDRSDIDMIVFATLSPDHEFPGNACFLQAKLDLPGIPAIDVRQQCTGFVYATSIADAMIRAGNASTVLVVGAEIHSKGLDLTTRGRDVSVLFGDGAGAAVMQATEVSDPAVDSHVLSTHLHADGAFAEALWLPAPGMAYEKFSTSAQLEAGLQYPQMDGRAVFVNAVTRMPEAVEEALAANDLTADDIDVFVFHQANMRIIEAAAHRLGAPADKIVNTIDHTANTTAATLPICLDEAAKSGRLEAGMLVAAAAFGSGFTWGSMIIRW